MSTENLYRPIASASGQNALGVEEEVPFLLLSNCRLNLLRFFQATTFNPIELVSAKERIFISVGVKVIKGEIQEIEFVEFVEFVEFEAVR